MFETRCTNGDNISGGNLRTRAATLARVSHVWCDDWCNRDLPFNSLVLDLPILVVQGQQNTIDDLSTSMIVGCQEVGCS